MNKLGGKTELELPVSVIGISPRGALRSLLARR